MKVYEIPLALAEHDSDIKIKACTQKLLSHLLPHFVLIICSDIRLAFTVQLAIGFRFCTLQFCKCDISESIIATVLKLLSA